MVKSTIVGYPRIGAKRELKFAVEDYFNEKLNEKELEDIAKKLRVEHWKVQKEKGIDLIPSNDFSFYDNLLDTAFLLNIIPKRYKELNLSKMETYFAMARGYQKDECDVKALPMKKWFNTNYHYIVPELEDTTILKVNNDRPFRLYKEAKAISIDTKPVLIGPFTLIKLTNIKGNKNISDWIKPLTDVYIDILEEFCNVGISYLQIDEPILVTDLTEEDKKIFKDIYRKLLDKDYKYKVILQSYFGDLRDIYEEVIELDFDGYGLDLIEGKENFNLIEKYGFPEKKLLLAGIVNGKNIWRNNYESSIEMIEKLSEYVRKEDIYISTSCSLLHVPYTVRTEKKLEAQYKVALSFAEEKLEEIGELKLLINDVDYKRNHLFMENKKIVKERLKNPLCFNKDVRDRVNNLREIDFKRNDDFDERRKIQKSIFNLPILPTTTIGSFPQTTEIKNIRKEFRIGEILEDQYKEKLKEKTREIIKFQEEIGLDILVHGEYERTDMVEYFGRLLEGFIFTDNGWVQSYGTRGVKPPIIFGDVKRSRELTVNWSKFAQGLTNKIVKGMLTGPITILNWSFPREDLELKNMAYQIGLAIGDEVLALEANGIKIIQIDEAALREKLPLRKVDWYKEYLDFAIPAFRLTNSKVKAETSIHTHMCYSEFEDIIKAIDDMDADVISIEAARSDFSLLDFLRESNFKLEIGPGVYDIHSPRVPRVEEIEGLIEKIVNKLDLNKIWINPDCGLKTRGIKETKESLINMVKATKNIREKLN